MGVTMQQVPRATDRRGSLLVRRSIIAAGALEDAETSSSSGAWQPQDSILEVEPSAGSAPGQQPASARLRQMPCRGCAQWNGQTAAWAHQYGTEG